MMDALQEFSLFFVSGLWHRGMVKYIQPTAINLLCHVGVTTIDLKRLTTVFGFHQQMKQTPGYGQITVDQVAILSAVPL